MSNQIEKLIEQRHIARDKYHQAVYTMCNASCPAMGRLLAGSRQVRYFNQREAIDEKLAALGVQVNKETDAIAWQHYKRMRDDVKKAEGAEKLAAFWAAEKVES